MVSIEVEGETITLRVLGMHRFWAMKGSVILRRTQITLARIAEKSLRPPWIRCPGTCLPWVICAGTYYGKKRKEFWDVTAKGRAICLELTGAPYTRVVVDVADPVAALRLLYF